MATIIVPGYFVSDIIKTIILPYSYVSIIRVVAVHFNRIRKETEYLALAEVK